MVHTWLRTFRSIPLLPVTRVLLRFFSNAARCGTRSIATALHTTYTPHAHYLPLSRFGLTHTVLLRAAARCHWRWQTGRNMFVALYYRAYITFAPRGSLLHTNAGRRGLDRALHCYLSGHSLASYLGLRTPLPFALPRRAPQAQAAAFSCLFLPRLGMKVARLCAHASAQHARLATLLPPTPPTASIRRSLWRGLSTSADVDSCVLYRTIKLTRNTGQNKTVAICNSAPPRMILDIARVVSCPLCAPSRADSFVSMLLYRIGRISVPALWITCYLPPALHLPPALCTPSALLRTILLWIPAAWCGSALCARLHHHAARLLLIWICLRIACEGRAHARAHSACRLLPLAPPILCQPSCYLSFLPVARWHGSTAFYARISYLQRIRRDDALWTFLNSAAAHRRFARCSTLLPYLFSFCYRLPARKPATG